MLLPPNLLLWDEEVPDFNTCLQVTAQTQSRCVPDASGSGSANVDRW